MVKLVKVGNEYSSAQHMEYIIDSADDVSSLPDITQCSAGSIAVCADGITYMLTPSGDWSVYTATSSGGSGGVDASQLDAKQDKLTAGDGISIDEDNTISSTDVLVSDVEHQSLHMPLATATGNNSIAFGKSNATGDYSIAGGYNCSSSGNSSIAIGNGSSASGMNSTAFGHGANASSLGTFASGFSSKANGMYSTAIGSSSESSGVNSVSIGATSKVIGNASVAIGTYTTATGNNQSVYGYANAEDANSKIIIGDGTGPSARHNAMTIDKNHNAKFAGDVYACSDDGAKKLATEDYVDDAIDNIDTSGIETISPDTLSELLEYDGYKNCSYFSVVVKEETEDDDAIVMQLNGLIQIVMEYDYQLPGIIHYVYDYASGYSYMFEKGNYVNRYLMESVKNETDALKEDILALQTGKVGTTDSRLTDARTPTAHSHAVADVTGFDGAVKTALTTGDSWTGTEKSSARQKLGFVQLTQEEYNLLVTPDENTIYIIIGDGT